MCIQNSEPHSYHNTRSRFFTVYQQEPHLHFKSFLARFSRHASKYLDLALYARTEKIFGQENCKRRMTPTIKYSSFWRQLDL